MACGLEWLNGGVITRQWGGGRKKIQSQEGEVMRDGQQDDRLMKNTKQELRQQREVSGVG
jgi:hypothetical protein